MLTGSTGVLDAANGITVTATAASLTLVGDMTYQTSANLIGPAVVLAGSDSTAVQPSLIITGNLDLSQGGQLTTFTAPSGGQPGDTWTVLNAEPMPNNPGNVVLTGPLTFGNLSIIAAGDITVTGGIDLSGTNGGNLTMIAGYNFDLVTGGTQQFTFGTISNFTPSAGGSDCGYRNH